jgi:hypothetical protein
MTNYNSIDSAYIGDSGLKIVSQDGEFTLKKGSFKVPFQSSIGYSYNQNLAVNHSGSFIISRYNEALMIGAKKVMVYTDYSNTPIYGVLLFNPIPSRVSGPEARSYSIRVPSNYVSLAKGGNVSVVYEAATITGTQYRAYTWVLWMSDIPF